VEEIVETVFEVPTSLGSISALEAETREALASPYHEGVTTDLARCSVATGM
jgi:hypothetical protein